MYKLSEREKLLLSVVELDARRSFREIARVIKAKEHSARYSLLRLQNLNVISLPRPIIDWNILGYIHHSLFFSLGSKTARTREKILKALYTNQQVSWIFELGGEFHFGISLSVIDIRAISEFLRNLSSQFGDSIFSKSLTTQIQFHYFGRRYLNPTAKSRTSVEFSINHQQLVTIDDVDQAIIKGLTTERYKSVRELSLKLQIPQPTVDRRIHQLEALGVIRGYFYWIDTEKLGVQRFVFLMKSRGLGTPFMAELLQYAQAEINVTYLTECIGEWDFEIGIEVMSSNEISALTQRLYERLGDKIQALNIIPILKYFKYRNYLPSEE